VFYSASADLLCAVALYPYSLSDFDRDRTQCQTNAIIPSLSFAMNFTGQHQIHTPSYSKQGKAGQRHNGIEIPHNRKAELA
jgi:hypothetical protein